jgi:hypothetical protein
VSILHLLARLLVDKPCSNKFPHSSFNWVGIDGTQVLCHMTPVETYTAQATVGDVNKGVTNHKVRLLPSSVSGLRLTRPFVELGIL